MARIRMMSDDEATGELDQVFTGLRANNPGGAVPDIMRTMSLRPDLLALMSQAAGRLHFRDGYLTRAQHEMIASYVSALTRCHY